MRLAVNNRSSIIPGTGLALGFTVFYISCIVLIPLSALAVKSFAGGWIGFLQAVTEPRVIAAYKFSLACSLAAAVISAVLGTLCAWVLVRYEFPGKKALDAMVDFPFALPTAVAGIALTTLFAPDGYIGSIFEAFGIKIAYATPGVVIALVFIGLPFVTRTVQPVLEDFDREVEEAAQSLGATKWQVFARVIMPNILPAIITGFAMAFARGLGEYGSVIFISSNLPMQTEITPLVILVKLEQYDIAGASAVALVMQIISFALLLLISFCQKLLRRDLE